MFVHELLHNLKKTPKGEVRYNEMLIELMEKLSIPLAVFFMGIIGAPLGAQVRSRGRFIGILLSLIIFLVYYMCLAGVRSISETGVLSPILGAWLPNLFLFIACVFLLHRAANERSFNFLERMVYKWRHRQSDG
jgi:lipopolysaccharide export LptBFGC system permease protein LptF